MACGRAEHPLRTLATIKRSRQSQKVVAAARPLAQAERPHATAPARQSAAADALRAEEGTSRWFRATPALAVGAVFDHDRVIRSGACGALCSRAIAALRPTASLEGFTRATAWPGCLSLRPWSYAPAELWPRGHGIEVSVLSTYRHKPCHLLRQMAPDRYRLLVAGVVSSADTSVQVVRETESTERHQARLSEHRKVAPQILSSVLW